ncbi:double zinc ribbon and ankyrin repeat-containing protein 1 [Salmo salar]|uniref:Double zinc ribbon and ankyrin repeat-containing protein 1 n=1 Tax=Salmo salar TaxID=8030 RepID=A0A1S3L711_SALSA|nr:double zinc ribbon and ankyrin repeat-containing protein 1 [Salmo salar]|eukprot:XP_013986605.1 PREDICTED: double zinc ribbon and ankyrin repeat-containing protein 1 isoform X2 [Salmo salar]
MKHQRSLINASISGPNMAAGCIVVPLIIPIRIPPPGKAKHEIDTTTPVELKSDTPDVTIYYTLDGTKPEVTKRPGFGENSTLKYSGPIRLPEGKVSVKALAITRDGRESAIVTKLFLVEYVPSNEPPSIEDKEDNFLKEYERDLPRQEMGTANGSGDASLKLQVPKTYWPPKGPRFLSSRLGLVSPAPEPMSSHRSQTLNASLEDSPFKNLTSTQMSRIQRETDFLRCVKCLSHRPSDPFARFCLQCGTAVLPVPGQRLPPTEGGQMGLCVHCKTMVPVNTPTCVVCEAPMSPQLQPQASLRLQNKVICPSCGTGNPPHISNCVTCETKLLQPPTAVFGGQSAPPLPSGAGKMMSCSKCSRVNHSDARFCDWCGSKPGHSVSCLICSRCGASSHPYANFCGSCGVFLEGPPRGESRASLAYSMGGKLELERMSTHTSDGATATWQAVPSSVSPGVALALAPARADQQTQTVGLFYPSGTEVHRKGQQVALELRRQEQMRDRRPLLTAISPGRGYWRKQLDHVCAHLRSYTQNNTDFRALIGEPRMGRMVSAVIQEDNYEVSLRINFVSAGLEKTKSCQLDGTEKPLILSENQNLSSVTEGMSGLSARQTSLGEKGSENATSKSAASRRTVKNLSQSWTSDVAQKPPPSKDSLLLREVGPDGRGEISVVQQLLDVGADPSCQGCDGHPALVVAVLHEHHEVLPVLVQRGADVNLQSGPVNNTALHEAAALGSKGLRCAETLLGCNASIRKKNDRGLTAYDLAVTSDCSPLVSLLAAKMGQGMLDRLVKPRTHPSLDAF